MQTLTIRVFESTGFSKNPVKNPVKAFLQCFSKVNDERHDSPVG